MVNVLDCDDEVSEFELQSRYHVHFQNNHHQVTPLARISLILSHHPSLSSIAPSRSSSLHSCIGTELLYIGSFAGRPAFCSSMWRGPHEYRDYEFIPNSPTISRMSGSCNFDSSSWWVVGGRTAAALLSSASRIIPLGNACIPLFPYSYMFKYYHYCSSRRTGLTLDNPLSVVFWPFDLAKNAIPKWCTGRRWHILMTVMRGNRVGENWQMKWDELKNSHGTLRDWCTGREWPLNCMTVISAWWRLNIRFQRSSGRRTII